MVVPGDWLVDAWWFVNRPDSHALRKLFLLPCQCLKTKLICLVTSRSFKYEDESSNIFPKDKQKQTRFFYTLPEANTYSTWKQFLVGRQAFPLGAKGLVSGGPNSLFLPQFQLEINLRIRLVLGDPQTSSSLDVLRFDLWIQLVLLAWCWEGFCRNKSGINTKRRGRTKVSRIEAILFLAFLGPWSGYESLQQ